MVAVTGAGAVVVQICEDDGWMREGGVMQVRVEEDGGGCRFWCGCDSTAMGRWCGGCNGEVHGGWKVGGGGYWYGHGGRGERLGLGFHLGRWWRGKLWLAN